MWHCFTKCPCRSIHYISDLWPLPKQWMIGERREGGNHTNQISARLQIAFVHFLPYAWHKPDLCSKQQHKHNAKHCLQCSLTLLSQFSWRYCYYKAWVKIWLLHFNKGLKSAKIRECNQEKLVSYNWFDLNKQNYNLFSNLISSVSLKHITWLIELIRCQLHTLATCLVWMPNSLTTEYLDKIQVNQLPACCRSASAECCIDKCLYECQCSLSGRTQGQQL